MCCELDRCQQTTAVTTVQVTSQPCICSGAQRNAEKSEHTSTARDGERLCLPVPVEHKGSGYFLSFGMEGIVVDLNFGKLTWFLKVYALEGCHFNLDLPYYRNVDLFRHIRHNNFLNMLLESLQANCGTIVQKWLPDSNLKRRMICQLLCDIPLRGLQV